MGQVLPILSMRKLENREVKQISPHPKLLCGRTRMKHQQREKRILSYVCVDFLDIIWMSLQTIKASDFSIPRTFIPTTFWNSPSV